MTIKLTAGQASAFNAPVIGSLFSDSNRTFPYKDALRLSDMVDQCQKKIAAYRTQIERIVKDCNGEVEYPTGVIRYKTPEDQITAQEQIAELDKTELEINGEKVKPKKNWPNLTVVEASILRPLLIEE